MNVAVNEDGAFVAMRLRAPRCARDRLVDRALRAGVVQLLPGGGDEVPEPARLFATGRQTAVGGGSPDASRRRAEDLVASADGQSKFEERPAETFEQECAARGVIAQQSDATV